MYDCEAERRIVVAEAVGPALLPPIGPFCGELVPWRILAEMWRRIAQRRNPSLPIFAASKINKINTRYAVPYFTEFFHVHSPDCQLR